MDVKLALSPYGKKIYLKTGRGEEREVVKRGWRQLHNKEQIIHEILLECKI
jgi:hypothetical protein